MPLSDARETGANALLSRVGGGRRASETTQCAGQHSAARHSVSDGNLEVLRGMPGRIDEAPDTGSAPVGESEPVPG
jgi:hypothetical protein